MGGNVAIRVRGADQNRFGVLLKGGIDMGIFEKLGVKPLINASGTITRVGGAWMTREALDAITEAAFQSVRLDELQAAASRIIAERTHAEAGIVTNGTSAALMLATAACICGLDVARMNRLPDTRNMPDEVIMPWHQISGYSHAIRAAGAKIIGVGIPNSTTPPREVHTIGAWDVEAAITEKTAAIALADREGAHPPLTDVVAIGRKYAIPIIVDVAAQVPPVKNLYRFIDMGADLVCISGGKGIRGPQGSGILCGRKELIASALLQSQDMAGESFELWDPPKDLIPKENLKGKPEHGIGRGCKVTKEEIVGLLAALDNFTEENFAALSARLRGFLGDIADRIKDVAGIRMQIIEDYPGGYPMLDVSLDASVLGMKARDIWESLRRDGILARDSYLDDGRLIIHTINMNEASAAFIAERLHAALSEKR